MLSKLIDDEVKRMVAEALAERDSLQADALAEALPALEEAERAARVADAALRLGSEQWRGGDLNAELVRRSGELTCATAAVEEVRRARGRAQSRIREIDRDLSCREEAPAALVNHRALVAKIEECAARASRIAETMPTLQLELAEATAARDNARQAAATQELEARISGGRPEIDKPPALAKLDDAVRSRQAMVTAAERAHSEAIEAARDLGQQAESAGRQYRAIREAPIYLPWREL